MVGIGSKDTLCNTPSCALSEEESSATHGLESFRILSTCKRARLESNESILNNGEEIIIKYTWSRSFHTSGSVLELNLGDVLGTAPLDSVGVIRVARIGITVIEGCNICWSIVRKRMHY